VQWTTSLNTQGRPQRWLVSALLGLSVVALPSCSPSKDAQDAGQREEAGRTEDASRAAEGGVCHGVGHYQVGKEGGYLPCCAGLHEALQQEAGETGDTRERICSDSVVHRNYVCVEGTCGDGRCEAPESIACGCPKDCPSAVWQGTDAGTRATSSDASVKADSGVQPDAGTPALVPSLASVQQSYLGWTRHSEQPQAISSEIFSLCRLPTPAETTFVDSPHGDDLYLLDYLNDAAVRGDASKANTPFPVGAAIVKQKLTSGFSGEYLISALGLMLKHEPGFDPTHGDWEFGYWTPSEGLRAGPATATACGGCHAGSQTDFVFLDQSWRR
jgi:cytochrome c553